MSGAGGVGAAIALVVSELPGGLADAWAVVVDPARPAPVNPDLDLAASPTLLTLSLGVARSAKLGGQDIPLNQGKPAVDPVFATSVAGHLPVGLAGILAAALFAASMPRASTPRSTRWRPRRSSTSWSRCAANHSKTARGCAARAP